MSVTVHDYCDLMRLPLSIDVFSRPLWTGNLLASAKFFDYAFCK